MPTTMLAPNKGTKIAPAWNDLIGNNTHTSINNKVTAMMSEFGQAQKAINQKAAALGNATGQPVGNIEYGANDGYFRRYQNGVIYIRLPAGPCWVQGAILSKYLSLGAEGGFLGYPTTDELPTPNGAGLHSHFERGSIYWTYATGAREIHGAIRDKWASLGWETSWLGFPKSDELPYSEDGRVSVFEHGSIYWWEDTGAIDLGDIAVRYKGLYCFGEADFDGFSDSDEPFVVFGTATVPPIQPSAIRTHIYDDVDSGDSRPDDIELYRGIPAGMALGAWIYDHNYADPDKYLGLVKQGVELAGKGVRTACGALFGAEAVPVCDSLWGAVAPELVKAVNDLLNTGEKSLGHTSLIFTAKEMVTMAGSPRTNFWGIEYNQQSPLISGAGASSKVYFDIVRV